MGLLVFRSLKGNILVRNTSNKPLDKDLEDGSSNQSVQKTNCRVIHVPEGPHSDLAEQEDHERNDERKESCQPDRHDLVSERVRKLGVDNLAILEGN